MARQGGNGHANSGHARSGRSCLRVHVWTKTRAVCCEAGARVVGFSNVKRAHVGTIEGGP